MKRKATTCMTEELEIDSLIENMQLMNCFNGYDEYKILRECYDIKNKLNELNLEEIKRILEKTYLRYKRYIINVNLEGLLNIEKGIYKFLRIYNNETHINNVLIKSKQLLDIMIETDCLILDEIDNYPETTKRYKK